MRENKLLLLALLSFLLTSCGLFTDVYQKNQRKVLDYLLSDLPLPKDAEILKEPSVVLGTGDAISARIVLQSNYSPAENLIFYGNETPTTGWSLLSSKVGEEIDYANLVAFLSSDRSAYITGTAINLDGGMCPAV